MKSVYLDTNIVLDLLGNREPFYTDAAKLFSQADKNLVRLSVSALTFANTNYILLQSRKPVEAKQILRKLKLIVQVLPLDDKIIELALNDSDFKDYEDALHYFTAIEHGAEVLITRNLKDFRKAKIPVMTADQYLLTNK